MTKSDGDTDPVQTQTPGRWRITLSEVLPEGSWRVRLLELAQATPEGQKLGLAIEGIPPEARAHTAANRICTRRAAFVITPTARGPYALAAERKSGSTAGR